MARAQDLRQAIAAISEREGPMLSAYLSVNAEIPENQERAYLVRLREAMDQRGVPEDVQLRVREELDNETHPGGRTLAVFADEGGFFEIYRLQVDLPEIFSWGEPFEAPLLLALEENEAYGAVVVDAERFRYFVVSPLLDAPEGEVKGNGYVELDLAPNTPTPRGGGSTDLDPAGRKQDANIHKFYKDLGETTRDLTFQNGVQRLILAGPKERVTDFRDALPQELKERVATEEHVSLDAREGQILEQLEVARERAEYERAGQLLADIRESGIWGLENTINALQIENRVYHLAILWSLEGEIRWSDTDGLAVLDITSEESPYSGDQTRVRPLIEVLVDLAAARGARVDFLLGENENTDVLRDEFGGIAGLTRF